MEWEALLTLTVFGASVAVVVTAIVLSLWGLPRGRTPRSGRSGSTSRPGTRAARR